MSTRLSKRRKSATASTVPARQQLNAADSALLSVDRTLREMGCPGFETQMFVWLSGRANAASLEKAVAHLSRLHPVMSSRFVEAEERGWSYWKMRPRTRCPLTKIKLSSADENAVLECAGGLLSTPFDPAAADPIRFYLLHRPDGRDVFLMQYNHTLIDINATVPLLAEINRFSNDSAGRPFLSPPVVDKSSDRLRTFLRKFPLAHRKAAMRKTLDHWWQLLRTPTVMLGQTKPPRQDSIQLRVIRRELDPSMTRALQARVLKVCGFPSLSMAIMSSAFRAIHRLSPNGSSSGRNCVAGIGVDLGLRDREGLALQNLVSLIPIHAPIGELQDRDNLLRLLSRQMRERLAEESDLGLLQCLSILAKNPRKSRWLLDVPLKIGFSLWYAYFGALDAVGEPFAGTKVENVFYTGPSWPPMGITLLVSQFRERLSLQATYVPSSVPVDLANEFLETVVRDLTNESET
jgi:hypothetical protein